MPDVSANALAGLDVPARDVRVGTGGVDDLAVARPVQVQDCAFVAREEGVVGAGAGSVPEEDVTVHAARGDVLAGGVEAGAEDFARVACVCIIVR